MPAAIIGAGIAAAGSVAGGVASGKGAKKAAQVQANSAQQQLALQQQLYSQNEARFGSDIDLGNGAAKAYADLLGLTDNKVDAGAVLRATPGYQFRLSEALKGVNSNAYAAGLGNSGATYKALTDRAMGVADQGFNTYLGQIGDIANRGSGAKSALAGVSTNYGNASNAITQNNANAQSNIALAQSANQAQMLQGILRGIGQGFPTNASSYAPTTPTTTPTNVGIVPSFWRA